MKTLCLLLLLAGTTAACGQTNAPAAKPQTLSKTGIDFRHQAEDVVTGVKVPWAIVFDPAGRMFFTERAGRVRVYENGKLREEPYFTVPDVLVASETGLMGMCLHPDYKTNKYVYLAFGYKGEGRDVRVVRYVDTGSTLQQDKVIVSGIGVKGNHSGCQIAFGPDGKLYISTGEMFEQDRAQDLKDLGGKFLRVNDDGTAPDDNPFVKTEGARPEIWTLGNRNPQGFDWHPDTKELFSTEHGPSGEVRDGSRPAGGGDEFNHIQKGKNYGWPEIFYDQKKEGMESPLVLWRRPTMAPGGGCFYDGEKFPELKGKYLAACLLGQQIRCITLDGSKVTSDDTLLTGYGRVRAITVGPDGFIYFSTSNRDGRGRAGETDDRIVRLKPLS
ncbi:MAG TPA: PQQ-dependent sugar dehydrogenase [Phycisphaerales bacterium]|nr:PQQ-dependent sugar dehydrogenase [Phycisphaerales bacterium]